jgi:hypothetical protein
MSFFDSAFFDATFFDVGEVTTTALPRPIIRKGISIAAAPTYGISIAAAPTYGIRQDEH